MPERVAGGGSARRLSRRQLGLLVGGTAAAACASLPPERRLAEVRPRRVVDLPTPDRTGRGTLGSALAQRHSVREYRQRELTVAEIGQLLWAGQGVTRSWGGRTAPSAGALYPLDLYAVTSRLLWHYLPDGHRAEQWDVSFELARELAAAALDNSAVRSAPFLVVVVGTTDRSRGKYGTRAERYVMLEAGHCTQNVLLQATDLGLAAVPIGAFADDAVRHRLGLSKAKTPYYLIPVGAAGTAG